MNNAGVGISDTNLWVGIMVWVGDNA